MSTRANEEPTKKGLAGDGWAIRGEWTKRPDGRTGENSGRALLSVVISPKAPQSFSIITNLLRLCNSSRRFLET